MIECDASGNALGAVLMQEGRTLAYLSQALKCKNLFLSTYEKEFLARVGGSRMEALSAGAQVQSED